MLWKRQSTIKRRKKAQNYLIPPLDSGITSFVSLPTRATPISAFMNFQWYIEVVQIFWFKRIAPCIQLTVTHAIFTAVLFGITWTTIQLFRVAVECWHAKSIHNLLGGMSLCGQLIWKSLLCCPYKQACKHRSQASSKLLVTESLTGVKWGATCVAKNWNKR